MKLGRKQATKCAARDCGEDAAWRVTFVRGLAVDLCEYHTHLVGKVHPGLVIDARNLRG